VGHGGTWWDQGWPADGFLGKHASEAMVLICFDHQRYSKM
jgi:hypothetical protein